MTWPYVLGMVTLWSMVAYLTYIFSFIMDNTAQIKHGYLGNDYRSGLIFAYHFFGWWLILLIYFFVLFIPWLINVRRIIAFLNSFPTAIIRWWNNYPANGDNE